MAYIAGNLSAIATTGGAPIAGEETGDSFTLWHYKTADLAADVDTAGYFNGASNMLRVGDFIMANTAVTTTTSSGVFIVKSNTGGVVDVSNITSFGLANTD